MRSINIVTNFVLVCLLVVQQFSLMDLKKEILDAKLKILELESKLQPSSNVPVDRIFSENTCT